MRQSEILRRVLGVLLLAAFFLPVVLVVCGAVAWLLSAMDDQAAAGVMRYVILTVFVMWLIDVVSLVLVQGLLGYLEPPDEPPPQ